MLAALAAFRLDDAPSEPVRLRFAPADSVAPLLRPPETAIVAPTRGAPLVATAGDRIAVDLVLRLPLTPPPGIQQERALNGFRGTATGHVQIGPRPTYPLRVTMIRPSGSATSYNATLELPPWMAPGVYDLEVVGRAFSERQERALVVRSGMVAVCELEPPGSAAEWPALAAAARKAVLSGAVLAELKGGIARDQTPEPAHESFARALDGIGLATAVRPGSHDLATGGASFRRRIGPIRWIDDTPADALGPVPLAELLLHDGTLESASDRPARAVVRVTTSEPSALAVDGRDARPASVHLTGDLDAPGVLRIYEIPVEPRARVRIELEPRTTRPAPVGLVAPPIVRVGERVTLEATGTPGAVGWTLGDESLAAGRRVRHRFLRLGRHDLRLAVARADGSVATASGKLRVETSVEQGCTCAE